MQFVKSADLMRR